MKKLVIRLLLPMLVLVYIPIFVIAVIVREITGKKAAIISDQLFIKGKRIEIQEIERLEIYAYFVGTDFKLKLRNHRRISIIPMRGTNLLAWAKRSGINLVVDGDKAAILSLESRLEYIARKGL